MVGFGLLIVIGLVISLVLEKREVRITGRTGGVWSGIFLLGTILVVCFTIGCNIYKIDRINRTKYYRTCIQLDKEQVNNLLPQINSMLAKYPDYEKTVFSGRNRSTFLNIPPTLKSDRIFMQAADNIEKYNTSIYNKKIAIANINCELNTMLQWAKIIVIFI